MPALTGSASNHSSLTKSAKGEAVQYRDADDNGGSAGYLDPADHNDPNISGDLPTKDAHDWQAGGMSGWQDNDDYMDYTYDASRVAESRLLSGICYPTGYSLKDGDYDDNGGKPTPPHGEEQTVSRHDGEFGTDEIAPISAWEGATRR